MLLKNKCFSDENRGLQIDCICFLIYLLFAFFLIFTGKAKKEGIKSAPFLLFVSREVCRREKSRQPDCRKTHTVYSQANR